MLETDEAEAAVMVLLEKVVGVNGRLVIDDMLEIAELLDAGVEVGTIVVGTVTVKTTTLELVGVVLRDTLVKLAMAMLAVFPSCLIDHGATYHIQR